MRKKELKDLETGDIIRVDISPTKGHEQSGYRPAVILTNPKDQKVLNGMVSIAPITGTKKGFPTHISLGSNTTIQGVILMEHHRMIDLGFRDFKYVEKLPDDLLLKCKEVHKALYENLFNIQ